MSKPVAAIDYHEQTKHTPQSVRRGPGLNFENKPRLYKAYANRPRESLPDSPPDLALPALQAITPTATTRERPPLDRDALAGVCYYAAGITTTIHRRGQTHHFRAAACTGALYHIDLYPICCDLPDLDAGVYHYDPQTDALDVLRKDDYRPVLADATNEPAVTFEGLVDGGVGGGRHPHCERFVDCFGGIQSGKDGRSKRITRLSGPRRPL